MDGRWPQRVEYCPGMRARHGVGHGVESQTWPFRSAPCLPIQQVRHRAIVRSATAAALRPRAQHEKACGYVDNARALPTSSQATAKTAKPCLIAYEPGRGQIRIRHPPRRLDGAQPLSYQAITPTMRRCWQPFTIHLKERCRAAGREPFCLRGREGTIWYYRELSARGVARLEAAVRHGSYAQSIPRPLGLAIESENF